MERFGDAYEVLGSITMSVRLPHVPFLCLYEMFQTQGRSEREQTRLTFFPVTRYNCFPPSFGSVVNELPCHHFIHQQQLIPAVSDLTRWTSPVVEVWKML